MDGGKIICAYAKISGGEVLRLRNKCLLLQMEKESRTLDLREWSRWWVTSFFLCKCMR